MAVFVSVADAGSFTAAAKKLGLTTSVVSHHVRKLEEQINTALFYRSTRALSLTSEGERLLEPARRMVAAAEQGLDAVADISAEPAGALTVTMPSFLSGSAIEKAICAFATQHASIALMLNTTDAPVDLIAEGYDLAIRFGQLKDSSLKTRRIGTFQRKLVCSPAYLAKVGPINVPEDLARCEVVAMDFLPDAVTLLKGRAKRTSKLERGRIQVDSIGTARAALLAGLGIQRMPFGEVEEDLQAKRLVELLPDWSLAALGIYTVWPADGQRNNLTRRLVEFLVQQKR